MLRIALFGQSGPYTPAALIALWKAQQGRDRDGMPPLWRLAQIVEGRSRPLGRRHHHYFDPKQTPNAAAPTVMPTLPACENIKDLGIAAGIPVIQTSDVNHPDICRHLVSRHIDVMVCVGFDRLFSRALLASCPIGQINAHPSKLPALRGPAPLFWLLRHGARASHVTIHGLDAREDHGPIYAQDPFLFPPGASGEHIYRIAGALAGRLLINILDRLALGTLVGIAQDHAAATRAPRPRPEDAYVDPQSWNAQDLINFASAASFFRTAWTRLGDETFFFRRGLHADLGRHMPGQFMQQGSYLALQCRDGIAHLEIQT